MHAKVGAASRPRQENKILMFEAFLGTKRSYPFTPEKRGGEMDYFLKGSEPNKLFFRSYFGLSAVGRTRDTCGT